MDLFRDIFKLFDVIFIYNIPVVVLLIFFFKKWINASLVRITLNQIRWIILSVTLIGIIHYVLGFLFFSEEYAFINRATGPYRWSFWLMLICSSIIPLIVFKKKIGHNMFVLFIVSVLMRSGMYFERFVIVVTSFHRDYLPDNWSNFDLTFLTKFFVIYLIQGIILLLLLLGVSYIIQRFNMKFLY